MAAKVKEQLDELHRISEDQWARYQQMLPTSDDVSLVVLKGHLIIEEMLYAIALEHCAKPDELAKARLTFAQLLHMVCALTKIPVMEACSPAISLLNTIRNSLVHNLEPKELEPRLHALQKLCEPTDFEYPPNYVKPTELPRIAESCICFLIGGLNVIGIVAALVEKNPQMLVRTNVS
ncbi:hypothetical protein [Luteimonas vadosa]|uniref:DUF4145 domain-containing protein n=1 Tax=Luteimonas vadosa TaxID=1165507 RepID=A0ABP9E4K1_9GAMM